MAETLVAKSTKASLDASTGLTSQPISGLIAGETIGACTPVYLKASDGKVWKASGAAANAAAVLLGWSARQANAGEPITVIPGPGLVMKYSDAGLTAAQILYLGTGGTLSSTASTGDAVGIAQAIDSSNIRATRAI